MTVAERVYSKERLLEFSEKVFLKIGCSPEHAQLASEVLVNADLRGIDSHGVARLSGYIRLWEKKRINPKPNIRVVHETASTATVDGDAGLGLVVAPFAMKIAIEKAKHAGSGWVAVRNSNHFGICAHHAMMALEHDMIGFACTNASPLVAPTYSTERMLGTNPVCYAIPAGEERPFILDMATAAAANGKLEIAQRSNKDVPEGWVQTREGDTSTDPHELKKGGSLLPLGSSKDLGSHKGYGLSSVVDIMSAVLSGASYGPWAPPFVAFLDPLADQPGQGLGHFLGCWRVDAFRPVDEFKSNMDRWIRRFRDSEALPGKQVKVAGEIEFEIYEERIHSGIPLNDQVIADLEKLAGEFDLSF